MWKEPDPDPGGQSPEPQSSREMKDLQDQNEQQQVLIAQLKEMLRKEQSTVPQEKVEEYMNTLSKAKAKKSRLKKDESGSMDKSSSSSMDSRKHERVNLLKQQMEENKARLAERGMRQKDIEEMVTAIKTQLNDSQHIITTTPSFEKNLDYNKNTSPEELYNILLVKDKRITDLLDKTKKQEGDILELQENLKEKDQVIDARTKAITLMTDNLSKKGKDTLDALDETKEQMRKMQENFVTLETEMKARQMVLLNDLKAKNVEITTLQDQNEKLIEEKNGILKNSNVTEKSDIDNHEVIIKDLQQKLADSKTLVDEYVVKIKELESKSQETEETDSQVQNSSLEKLKKQLDESNKNMIKVKAQNKSKIKELNKKLDAFKKMSDANVMIVQLQNDITKLNEKIAELEDEKGNVQLKMVESIDSLKSSIYAEEVKELQDKLTRNAEEFDEKEKVIHLLESEIISLKTEITNLTEKNISLSQLENEQVTSEMNAIQIEEQLENSQKENNKLQQEIDDLKKDNNELLEKIEGIEKEKSDLCTKLDNYIQENMELIDKLEKLSAEKVSSAESIEIVEGLTQQEKLELAAYQKNLETSMEEPTKTTEEEAPSELNETVSQLTEDSTELLNRIEMFNVERKEVMLKLDALRDENNRLSLKLNEIENYRDILAETYEQLQTEKDDLQKENEQLVKKLKQLEDEIENNDLHVQTVSKLQTIQNDYERLLEENKALQKSLKNLDTQVHEKDNLESELIDSNEKLAELEHKLRENIEEITNYQLIIEENKTELINSSSVINQLQTQLLERENDIKDLNVLINDLNVVVGDLQGANEKLGNFEFMEEQVKSLNEQVQLAQTQAEEFKEELAFKKLETENLIEHKNRENEKLSKELSHKEEIIKNLHEQLQEKDTKIHKIIEEMKQKYLGLQQQLDNNSGSLEKQIEDLSTKNKEQLEKMKKIAANLKKKTQAYQELEKRYIGEKEKWETEINKKESVNNEIEAIKQEVNVKIQIIDMLQQQNVDLQNMLIEARQKQEKVTEVSLKQELSTSLHEEFDNLHGSNESTNEDKINELQLIIETNETELNHYKERNQKLEQDLAVLLEEKDGLTNRSKELEEELNLMARNVEEKIILEKEFSRKLQEVTTNDETLSRTLEEVQAENKALIKKNRDHEELIVKLKIKIKKSQEKVSQLKTLQSNLEEQEQLNAELKKQLTNLENNQKQAQFDYEELQKQNQRDYEKIETDYQAQLEELVTNRNELIFEREKLEETVKGLKEKKEELKLENSEHKQKFNEFNDEIAKLNENLKFTSSNWQASILKIENLQSELDNLQKLIITNTATETVDSVISEAKEKIVDFSSKYTQTEDNFPQPIVVTKEDLESKIKALEVLLYNVDKEKEQVVSECSEMFNELTRLIYEKIKNKNVDLELGSQMLSPNDINDISDPFKLQQIEFEKCDTYTGPQSQPVVEIIAPPTSAYLTHQPILEMESEIMSAEEIDGLNDPKKLQQLEFAACDEPFGEQSFPVVEKLTQPTKAYLTYQVGEAVGENDDGWGWGPEEARLEEEHQYRTENTPQMQALKMELNELMVKVQNLQAEKEAHLKEIEHLQVKTGKLMKKCKELKIKNDEFSKKTEKSDFFDLEQTIQEELKTQLEQLEKKITEYNELLDKEKKEKVKLLNRVDVLTAANEKMTEMKEIQDCEVLKWKRKYEETQSSFGWNESEAVLKKESPEDSTEDIEELKSLVKDLTADNEELQALLDDQKQQRVQLERSKSVGNETRMQNLEEELDIKDNQIKNILIEKQAIEEQLNRLQNEELPIKIKLIQDLERTVRNNEELNAALREKCKESDNSAQLGVLEALLIEKTNLVDQFKYSNDSLNEQISILSDELERLKGCKESENSAQLKELKALLIEKTNLIDQFKYSNDSLNEQIRMLSDELERLKGCNESDKSVQIEELEALFIEKTALVDQFKYSNDSLKEQIRILSDESERLKNELQNLEANSAVVISNLEGQLEMQQNIQELSKNKASTLEELIHLFISDQEKLEELSLSYGKITETANGYYEKIMNLEHQLMELNQVYIDSSNNVLSLQTELQEYKQKLDQLQMEHVDTVNELEQFKTRCNELQFEKVSGTKLEENTDFEDGDGEIHEMKKIIENLRDEKGVLDEGIKMLKNDLNAKQVELDKVVAEMENKLVDTISDLEEKWATQVDERGNTVAESWKYHLNIVESDFAALQEKFKNEITELEEKCNALVNENNELRKNVDVEIKNEVDRISALQQQISDRQRSINELNQLLSTEQMEKLALITQVSDIEKIQQLLADKEVELASLKTLAETTRQQFDEKREVVEEIVRILENNTSFSLSCEKQDILTEIQRQLNLSSENKQELQAQIDSLNSQLQNYYILVQEKETEILRLQENNSQLNNCYTTIQEKETEILRLKEESTQLQTYYNSIQEKDIQISKLNEFNSNLQAQVDQIFEKDQEILELRQNIEQLKERLLGLEEKEAEILRLQKLVEEYKCQQEAHQQELLNLQKQCSEANYAVEDYKLKLEEFHQTHISLQTSIDEKNRQISSLNQLLQLATNNKETHNLETELSQYKQEYLMLQQSLAECQQQLFNITQDLATKSHESETLSQQLAYSQQNGELLQDEINRLNETLRTKEQEYAVSVENIGKTHDKELESHYEELMSAKDLDNQTLRVQVAESLYNANEQYRVRSELEQQLKQLEENTLEYSGLKQDLETQIRQLEEKLSEQSSLAEEENKQLNEMRGIIEEQVVKIEDLKKELFEKSKDYDSFIAEMDISRNAITQQPVSSGVRVGSRPEPPIQRQPESDDDPVNRAELDIALYMLHQRDVRCEELTVELTHLLEERDTLQLRLSNAIREKEELRSKYSGIMTPTEQPISTSADPESTRSRTSEIAATGTELASEPPEKIPTEQNLASKLSELRQIRYKKDKTFVDEQELRSLQQMSIMQQHIKEAAKLPPEAAAKLVDASYTLSRDIQSPSKVLLNWLWGRSTPKVNDT